VQFRSFFSFLTVQSADRGSPAREEAVAMSSLQLHRETCGSDDLKQGLPDFQTEIPIFANQFEVIAIGSDQQRPVRPRSKRDQDVEVKVT